MHAAEHVTIPSATVVELPDASVVGSDGVVLTHDGCVVEDLIRRWGASPETHPVWHQTPTQPVRVQGTAAVVAAQGAAVQVDGANAHRRRLRNETALAAALADSGFDTVDLAALPLSEQVALVQDTSTIVAVHGAGLTHLLHAPAGGHVIELVQPRQVHPEYWRLAALAGWHHDFVPARSSVPGGELNEDVDVDIDSVIACTG